MKREKNKILIFALAMIMIFALVGCTNRNINNPEDAIKDAYGNTQFKISFDSTALESPIADIFYTANNMPVLPTPTKIGFVFAGWYFDASFTEPCDVQSGDLLWKMKDLTLYPKWEEEKIVNNGTYEIEYNAKIVEKSISKASLGEKYGYQEFPDDIIASETYIEKNDKGIFLRLQYDNVVRGPVLGSSGADSDNFSKMTYTVTDTDNRINKDISILDRTNTIQTIYYDLKGLNLTDTITLHIEYFNWKVDIDDALRDQTTVGYDITFNITRFIGFDQAFINPEERLENGIYVIPTHYTGLDKVQSMLDMFNPVYAYIEAKGGHYTLYKPLNAYNNDFPNITPKEFPLRTSGYAREFACFKINKDKKITADIEHDKTGKIYLPEEIGANNYSNMSYEFHADTGRYYYSIDLGNTLDNDLVFIGGSSGAMEQMFSFPFDYRRLTLDYKSMVRIVDWDYKPLSGDEYTFKDKVALYPGSTLEFDGTNKDFDIFNKFRHVINMTNIFFTRTNGGDVEKVFDTKMTISANSIYKNPIEARGEYSLFDITYSAFDYDPMVDGDLYARDLSFITNVPYKYSNSTVNKKMNGKSLNIGEKVVLRDLYKEKVSNNVPATINFTVYDVDNNLNIISEGRSVNSSITFNKNIAIQCTSLNRDGSIVSSLVYLIEKKLPSIRIVGDEWTLDVEKEVYRTNKKFDMGTFIDIPEVLYTYNGKTYTTKGLKKDFDELAKYGDSALDQSIKNELPRTDYTKVSAWNYRQGIYSAINIVNRVEETKPNSKDIIMHDLIMGNDNIRVMIQLDNQFGEMTPIILEYETQQAGRYELSIDNKVVDGKDILYNDINRVPINFKMLSSYHIGGELDVNNIPSKFELKLIKNDNISIENILFHNAIIYLKGNTINVDKISDIWGYIASENYALISLLYTNEFGDKVEYKAEYNFRLENKIADDYFTIKDKSIIFNGEEFNLINPVMSAYDYTILGRGKLKVFKKYGNTFAPMDRKDGDFYSGGLNSHMQFNTSGTYMVCWEFALTTDQNGEIVFNGVDPHAIYTYIKFGICQEIDVVDKNSEAKLTYATDKAHPFDEAKKQELISQGYVFSEDVEYQYMTIPVRGDKVLYSIPYDYLASPDYTLFGWGDKKGNVQYFPSNQVQDVAVKQKTLEPILYAVYNVPLDIELEYDFDGKIYKPFDGKIKVMRKDPQFIYEGECQRFYVYSFFSNLPPELSGYEIYGWKTSIPVLKLFTNVDGHMVDTFTDNIKGGFTEEFAASKPFKITAIFKKSVYVSYEAVKETTNGDEELKFMGDYSTDYDLLSNEVLSEKISANKLSMLKNAKVTDINLTLKFWTVYDNTLGKWVKIDLDTFVLDNKYANSSGKITLRAVFG